MKPILSFLAGVLLTIGCFYTVAPHPSYTQTKSGWKLEHVPVPSCPDSYKRTVDIPERDEVDALTVTCAAHLPDRSLGLDADGRTE